MAVALVAVVGVVVAVDQAEAVDTDITVSTAAIDFGAVPVGTTVSRPLTLTNTGGDPFGPINMFGGAPPTAQFNASQNCQGQTLPAGGSCTITYQFAPNGEATFTDSSRFTVSETQSQSDGEDFTISLRGRGGVATTTTVTSTTTTTTAGSGPGPGGGASAGAGSETPAGATPPGPGGAEEEIAVSASGDLQLRIARDDVEPGETQEAVATGFQPGEEVSAVQRPGDLAIGTTTADESGQARFRWTIPEDQPLGAHVLVVTGTGSGSVASAFTVAADVDDAGSGVNGLLIAALALVGLAVVIVLVYLAYRGGRRSADPTRV